MITSVTTTTITITNVTLSFGSAHSKKSGGQKKAKGSEEEKVGSASAVGHCTREVLYKRRENFKRSSRELENHLIWSGSGGEPKV